MLESYNSILVIHQVHFFLQNKMPALPLNLINHFKYTRISLFIKYRFKIDEHISSRLETLITF